MVTDNRSIGAQTTNTVPAWRSTMTATNRVYQVTAALPNSANASISWPNGVEATHFSQSAFTPGDGTRLWGREVIEGYSSATVIDDDGAFGSMVFGSGGHDVIMNQVLRLNLSLDTPTFDWWQQPTYQTTDTAGADMYYHYATWQALIASRKFETLTSKQSAASIGWTPDNYACGLDGWIFPRRMVSDGLGNNVPMGYRYNTVDYLPAAVTGLGAGAWVHVRDFQLGAPFSLKSRPADVTDANWFDSTGIYVGSGRRRGTLSYRNCSTGAWAKVSGATPDVSLYSGDGSQSMYVAAARSKKRVYVGIDPSNAAWYYIDCANGMASATVSGVVAPGTSLSPNRVNSGALTDGSPHGRLLWYWLDALGAVSGRAKRLVVQDLDNGTQERLPDTIAVDIPVSGYRAAMAYRASDHSILIVYQDGADIKYTKVTLPSDPYNYGGYSVSTATLGYDAGVSVQSLTVMHGKYWVPSLGVFILPQGQHAPLAFRPA